MTDSLKTPEFDLRGFIENSLLEWENNVAAVVIAGGCNLRCPYCHSWRYVTGLKDLDRLDRDVVFALLDRQRGWIDGVVFTGGEPTLQPGLEDMIRRCREYEVKIKVHSNGTRPEVLERLLDERLVDCLALDYKAPGDDRLLEAAGRPSEKDLLTAVRKSFELAAATRIDVEYHTTLHPVVVTPETFALMSEDLEPRGLWILQQYENDDCLEPRLAGNARYDATELEDFAAMARRRHPNTLLKKGKSA